MAPVAASGLSPLASPPCSATPGTGSTLQPVPELFPNSEVEPWVDVGPVDGDGDGIVGDVVAGLYQQDRWSNGGARNNVASISFDGGATWQQLTFTGLTECDGGEFDRNTDPWLSFAPDCDLFASVLAWEPAPPDHPILQYPFDSTRSAVFRR